MGAMLSSDFLKQIKEDPNGAYLFYGEEDYLKYHALRAMKDAMNIEPALELFNYVRLDVLDYTPERLIDALTPPPMMAEKKLVVLSGVNFTTMRSDEISPLYDALSHVAEYDYNNFVLLLPSGFIDDSYKANNPNSHLSRLSKMFTPVKFEASTPQRLTSWAMKHFAHFKISATPDDCAFLIDYCGKNMFTLANEIEKLAFYIRSQGRDRLCRADIGEVSCAEIEYGAFEFANALLANKRAEALEVLSAMKFKQVEAIPIFGELARIYCDLISIKIILSAGKSQSDVCREMKMNEYKAGIYIRAARNMDTDRLRKLLDACCKADAELKLTYNKKDYAPLEKFICSI